MALFRLSGGEGGYIRVGTEQGDLISLVLFSQKRGKLTGEWRGLHDDELN
jgi:hypothetical protein